ncbi:MAG: YfhO family protein [Prevotellaceae bacterium]|jgi:hypothetical protein|nr:YfhO family protein [Prevotellaceae bacterium]
MKIKRILPDLLVIVAYALLSFAYFFPADVENRILFQHDTAAGAGAGQEAAVYHEQTGKTTRWTNSLFGGMPTYQISPSYQSTQPLTWLQKVYQLFLPSYVNLTFILMLGFFILLRAFGVSTWLAGLGGLLWAFSSYFFILISAGHIWKFITLAYIPPTIAGMVLAYRGKLLAGGVTTALFVAFQILSNHVQMSYYFLFVILFMVIAYAVEAWQQKTLPQFFKASGVLAIAAVIGVSINLSNLYHTYTYSKETMRGKSELVTTGQEAAQSSGGLDKDYITQWSYGVGETLTLLIPNYKGGSSSAALSQSSQAMKHAKQEYLQGGIYGLPQYFGDQPFTAGPVYVGAFVLFLFLLGCFVVKGPMKWALVGATLLSILLSWGKNFMPPTDFFIDYVPMYDKFRAVSSILVIAEFTIPLLAILGLKRIIDEPSLLRTDKKAFAVSLALTAGVALLVYWVPDLLGNSFVSSQEMAMLRGGGVPVNMIPEIIQNLGEMRSEMVSADAGRSLLVIAAGVLLLLLYGWGKLRASFTVGGIALLCLIDLWSVDKRYLNDSQFEPRTIRTETFKKTPADQLILKDTTLNYRVLNMAGNTFNENNTSYWHKSVGGYHAAKLRRYQDMIETYLTPEMNVIARSGGNIASIKPADIPVLNMLNTKYFILPTKSGEVPVQNPYAYGNAWFVDSIRYVDNANQELEAVGTNLSNETAVVDIRFRHLLKDAAQTACDSLAQIRLAAYEPNRLVYETDNCRNGVAVFSEIYYPDGWRATIDGKPADIARANYILRAMHIPAGTHTVEMRFDPQSLHITEGIAYTGLGILLLGLLAILLIQQRKKRG